MHVAPLHIQVGFCNNCQLPQLKVCICCAHREKDALNLLFLLVSGA
jgi:hypothetical protein